MGSKFYGKNRNKKTANNTEITETAVEEIKLEEIKNVHRAVNVFKNTTGKKPIYMKTTIIYDPATQECMVESIEPIADSYTTAMKKIVDEISLKLLKNKEEIKK